MSDSAEMLDVKVWKLYTGAIRKRRHWSMRRLEQWLNRREIAVLDTDMDERGEFMFVTTDNPELQAFIQSQVAA